MQRSRAMVGVQMDNVTRRGHKAKIPVLLFIEGIPACPHAAKSHPGWCGTCARFTYAPGTSCSTESQGKLRLSTGSELLKQSSADKPRILSSRERARA